MDVKELDALDGEVGAHWYYRSKLAAVSKLLRGVRYEKVLDVGAGSGFFSQHLLLHGAATEAWCIDTEYPSNSDDVIGGKPIHYWRSLSPGPLADLALFMDVLEHVDDDVGLLAGYRDRIKPQGHCLISVPAFQFLWCGHDEFLDHRRRYTLKQLEDVVRRAGFIVETGAYFYGLVFPLAVAARLYDKMRGSARNIPRSHLKSHSTPVNATLSAICRLELPLLKFNRLAGLTVFCVARRA